MHARAPVPSPSPSPSVQLSLVSSGWVRPDRRCYLDPRSFLKWARRWVPRMMAVKRSAGERVGTLSTPTTCAPHRFRFGLGETPAKHARTYLPALTASATATATATAAKPIQTNKPTRRAVHSAAAVSTRAVAPTNRPPDATPTSARRRLTSRIIDWPACASIWRQRRLLRYAHQ